MEDLINLSIHESLQLDPKQAEGIPAWHATVIQLLGAATTLALEWAPELHNQDLEIRKTAMERVSQAFQVSEICKEYRISRHKLEEAMREGAPRTSKPRGEPTSGRRGRGKRSTTPEQPETPSPSRFANLKPPGVSAL